MKKLKKISKIIIISLSIIFASAIVSAVGYYHFVTYGISLDNEKIESSKSSAISIYDKNFNKIIPISENYIEINKISANTKNAFICAEDKRFYSHNGIDYIRVGGALISNIKSKSFSEGASTISQQLIKNTLLSNEKTINRKLKEFKLARELENNYTKDEILELYLNNIYFGSGAYGIENASNYYFGKSASNLTLAESALLAGTINAPSVYSIQSNPEKALKRRNLILTLMNNQGKISEEEMLKAQNEKLTLNITKPSNTSYVFNNIIEEACKILNITENELKNSNLEIQTNYDQSLTNIIDSNIKSNFSEISKHNTCGIIIDNTNNSIVGILGDAKILNENKQPGSIIKPILVYAPAIENNIVSPSTKLLDEEINISGYSPENADNKYHGFVSVRECLKNSYNIPAVKLLNEIGILNAQNFAQKLNINFSKNDNHLAIALGGFTEGVTIKQLADAYTTFANNGKFSESRYITKITKNNKTIYSKSDQKTTVMLDSTAYLITDMLIDTSKSGTAKKLADLNYQVASKTGTVGKQNSNKNTDAYCVSYTSKHTIITYVGDKELAENINGATYPTLINKSILKTLYKNKKPADFIKPASVITKYINKEENTNHSVNQSPTHNETIEENFQETNIPKNTSLNLTIEAFNFENRKPIITFFASNKYTYNIIRIHEKKEEKISSLSPKDDLKIIKYEDISAKYSEIYEYLIEICDKSSNQKYYTNRIKLKAN